MLADAYDVSLISNNTRHVWYIHNVDLKGETFDIEDTSQPSVEDQVLET